MIDIKALAMRMEKLIISQLDDLDRKSVKIGIKGGDQSTTAREMRSIVSAMNSWRREGAK